MNRENIVKVEYEDEMKKSYIDYAMSVIVQRALPDVRDGFKPVHRRILYAMNELGLSPDKQHRKSARIVGDVLGKFHPHGDSSVYEAMVRMSQDFAMSAPLVDGHGNFGSIDGDSAAAMRYTEARLTPVSMDILKDIDRGLVDFRDNFDGSLKEPVVLPSLFPNLIVNGVSGIAVGMATYIPPHNTVEVITAILKYLDNQNITIPAIMNSIKGPDFPTGGIVINKDALNKIYEDGNGRIRVRAKIERENAGNGRVNLIITEIPYSYSGNKTLLIENMINSMKAGKLQELTDIRDESSREGIRIVLAVKKGIDIDKLLVKLYKKTPLEDTIAVNFLAIVDERPKVLNIKQLIEHYVSFQKEINIRKYQSLLEKALEKKEVLEGLVRATDCIDTIIEVLRASKDVKMAKNCLMNGDTTSMVFRTKQAEKLASKFDFTERQAVAILEMRLQKLIGLEIEKLNEEHADILKKIAAYKDILENESSLIEVIKGYLKEMKTKYASKRKTQITEVEKVEYVEEFIEEDIVLLMDRFGYVKTVDTTNYNRSNEETIKEFKHIFETKNTDKLCLFTKDGTLHQIKMTDVVRVKIKEKGVPLDNLTKADMDNVILMDTLSNLIDKKLVFMTQSGLIKKVEGSQFETNRAELTASKLADGDCVVSIKYASENPEAKAVIKTKDNFILKFDAENIPLLKRTSIGQKGIALEPGDEVTEFIPELDKDEEMIMAIGNKGVDLNKMRTKKRGQKGVKF